MRTVRAAFWVALAAACTPAGGRGGSTMPVLPGDEAKKEDPASKPAAETKPAEGPKKPEADPWAGRTDLIQAPPPAAASSVNLPKIERFTLSNGLSVLVVEDHHLPVANFHLAVKVGEQDEARDKRGISQFESVMLTKGTKAHTADQISETMDFLGGSLAASADLETTHVTCSVLSKDVQSCLAMLPEVVATPSFPEKEMGEVREKFLGSLKNVRDNPEQLAAEHFDNALWGEDHVRGWPITPDTIGGIGTKDLAAWHDAWFRPNNSILAIAGDVDAKALKAQLEKTFGGWKKGTVPTHKQYAEPRLAGIEIRMVDKPDATQSQIFVGHLGISHGDPDYFAVQLMDYTLGGGPASRLTQVVRAQGGKTYGASSFFERWKTRGAFEATTFTRTQETIPTLLLVLGEIAKMQKEGPTEAELADARAYFVGAYPTRFQSASDVATNVLSAELHGLGEEYVRNFPLKIAGVTLGDVRAAAQKRLTPGNVVIVIVGKADEIEPQIAKLPKFQQLIAGYERVGFLEPISKHDRENKSATAKAPPDPKAEAEGKKILDAALAAKGGEAKLKGIKNVAYVGTVKISAQGRVLEGKYARWLVVPDKLRFDIEVPEMGGAISLVVAGEQAWQAAANRVADLPREAVAEGKAALWHDRELVLLRHKDADTVVESKGKITIGGVDYDAVLVRKKGGEWAATLFFDPKTHLLFRMDYDEGGAPSRDDFSNYKSADGVQIAMTHHQEQAGQVSFDITYTDVKINADLPAGAFEKPAK